MPLAGKERNLLSSLEVDTIMYSRTKRTRNMHVWKCRNREGQSSAHPTTTHISWQNRSIHWALYSGSKANQHLLFTVLLRWKNCHQATCLKPTWWFCCSLRSTLVLHQRRPIGTSCCPANGAVVGQPWMRVIPDWDTSSSKALCIPVIWSVFAFCQIISQRHEGIIPSLFLYKRSK